MTAEIADNMRQASRYLLQAARSRYLAERNLCRPSVLLGAELAEYVCTVTGETFYAASYDCLFATGQTPDEAFLNFDAAWIEGQD
jgi:hypothetical protein